jgi:8-oxo-dGTP pyrophosphatase MutT (NUDIX family)
MKKEFVRYSTAIMLVSGDKLYVSQRDSRKLYPNYWQFAGGKVDEGENPVVGAQRELLEETGLNISLDRLQYVSSITREGVCYVYRVDLNEGEVPQRTEPDAMGEWKAMTLAEIRQLPLVLPGIINVVESLIL